MPVINGVYLKDFTALPGAVADANIIPIAISGNQIAYRTTVAGIVTDARITGKLLTGLSITGGAVVAADTILAAFGKVQNQINGINLALYVPYTGATGAVNLGAYDLTVHSINIGRGAGSIATNTRVGESALNANTTGGVNTAIGRFALTANTEGDFNTAVGASSLIANTTGSSNSALGYVSLTANTTGTLNSALGNLALTNNTTGANNTAIGYSSLAGNTTGSSNVAVGYTAGNFVNAGTDNITSGTSVYLGSDTRASASGNQNEIVIGYEGRGNGSNTVTIGNSSIANNYFIGNIRGGAFIKLGGTSAQFLKADGTVDSNTYGSGTVTSVAAITLGTTGTDLSSTVANGTTTPIITLQVPTASATNRGALSSADWSTFNGKQDALSGTGIVKSTAGVISYLTDPLPIANGGTGSATQNFVDLTTTQTIAGFKTFTSTIKLTNGTSNAFLFESGTTGFYTTLKAPAGLAADIIVTLPSTTGTIALTSAIPANPVGGTGTTNTLPKFTAASTIGDSAITDDGTTVTLVSRALSGTSATFSGTLDTGDTITLTKSQNAATSIKILNTNVGSVASQSLFFDNDARANLMTLRGYSNAAGSSMPDISDSVLLRSNGAGGLTLSAQHASGVIRFSTGGVTERVRIDASGNVGIGSSSPSEKLQVTGGRIYPTGTGTSSGITWDNYNVYQDTSNNLIYRYGTTEIFRLASTGVFTFNSTGTASGAFISSGTTPYWSFQSSSASATGYLGFGNSLISGASSTDFIIRSDNALKFAIGGTAALSIASTGAATFSSGIGIGGATATTGGIQFPATAVAIADGNNLDDYEEGTWTPSLTTSGGTPPTVVSSAGRYVIIGKLVNIYFKFLLSSASGGSAQLKITNSPLTISSSTIKAVGFARSVDLGLTYNCGFLSGTVINFNKYDGGYAGSDFEVVGMVSYYND